jgi:serine/threonine protein kinase
MGVAEEKDSGDYLGVGQTLGKYRLDKQLGEGGMGVVWLGHHPDFSIPVAIKTIKDGEPAFVDRFLQEARSAALINHPRVARIFDAGSDADTHFIVMEYLPGGDIGDLLSDGPLSTERALYIVEAVAQGLAAAAKAGIIHRDIKPDNIMLDAEGEPKLVDLGLAKELNSETSLTVTGAMMGTPAYIAPEQAQSCKTIDIRADIYSLGATLFHLVTGEIPFKADSAMSMALAHCMQPTPDPSSHDHKLSKPLCSLIMKMMAKDPADRYQTPDELVEAIAQLRRSIPPASVKREKPATANSPDDVGYSSLRSRALPVAAVLVLLLVIAVLARPKSSKRPTPSKSLTSLSLSGSQSSAQVGKSVIFTLDGTYKDGSTQPITAGATLTATPDAGATISGMNVALTGLVAGPVRITADLAGESASATLRNSREYMAIDISPEGKPANSVSYLDSEPSDLHEDIRWKTTTILLRRVPKGTFMMGSPNTETDREVWGDRETLHEVTLTKPFYIGVFEVTQGQWQLIMASNPASTAGTSRPVEQVRFDDIRGTAEGMGWPKHNRVDADSFLGRLRSRTAVELDLPTEAQWEYACRAGTSTAFSFGEDPTKLHNYGNYRDISSGLPIGKRSMDKTDLEHDDGWKTTSDVGAFRRSNAWGLYDMHGNVSELCLDWQRADLGEKPLTDPVRAKSGADIPEAGDHHFRGGNWSNIAAHCRAAYRGRVASDFSAKDIGLRLVYSPLTTTQ